MLLVLGVVEFMPFRYRRVCGDSINKVPFWIYSLMKIRLRLGA